MHPEILNWWNSIPAEVKSGLQTGGIVLAALLVGYFVGSLVSRILRHRNFDAALRLPGSRTAETDSARSFSPTFLAGVLVGLTIWTFAGAWLAKQYGRPDIATTIGVILKNTWALAAVLTATLTVANVLASRLIDCLGGSASSSRFNIAGAVGAVAYCLVVLVALLVVADIFQWPLTRNAAVTLWQFGQYLLVSGAALGIGCIGANWARELVRDQGTMTPEKRAGQYTALVVVALSTVLAVIVLLSSAGLLMALAVLAVAAALLWLGRGYLPDLVAGIQLRTYSVRQLTFEGVVWQVNEIGLVNTQLNLNGQFWSVQNRIALEQCMRQQPAQSASNVHQPTPMSSHHPHGNPADYPQEMPAYDYGHDADVIHSH